ncbi:MAG: hypothetical protein OXT67_02610 [Zetaproteobacteria bacterium]|nr:hypothetical protein [Zetaproteobacteria bacterium]
MAQSVQFRARPHLAKLWFTEHLATHWRWAVFLLWSAFFPLQHIKAQSLSDLSEKYNVCRRAAIKKYKSKGPAQVSAGLNTCRMMYPGAYLYVKCMKKRENFKSNLSEASCLRAYEQTLMQAGGDLPFFFIKDKLIFGGLGLVEKFNAKAIVSQSHLACDSLKSMLEGDNPTEFTFFGNNPQIFASYDRQKWLQKTQAVDKSQLNTGVDLQGLGRIYASLTDLQSNLLLPHGSCAMKGLRNERVQEMKWYFLQDQDAVIPYAGLVTYTPGVIKKINKLVRNAAKRLAKANPLAKPRKISSRSKGVTILAARTPPAWSALGEPKDFCRDAEEIGYVVFVNEDAETRSVGSVLAINLPLMCMGYESALSNWLQ